MANNSEIKHLIDEFIHDNNRQEITGNVLNRVLKAMVDASGQGAGDVLVAVYNSTPYADIHEAYLAGKAIVLKDNDRFMLMDSIGVNDEYKFFGLGPDTMEEAVVFSDNVWDHTTTQAPYEKVVNKILELTDASTDAKYPSAKAVVDFVNSKVSGKMFVAEYGVSRFNNIVEVVEAGDRIVVCRDGAKMYSFVSKTSESVVFSVTEGDSVYSVTVSSANTWTSEAVAYLHRLNTTNETAQTPQANEDLRGEINLHKVSKTGNYNDLLNKPDLSQFITKAVNDLVNYYTKSETYTKAEVQALIGAIQQFHYEVYASTSAVTNPANNVLYLIGPTGTGSDKYEEYVYDSTKPAAERWIKIGDTSIDLSGYVTTEALNTALAAYTTTANLTTLLAAKQDTIADLSTIRSGAAAGATAYQKPAGGIPKLDLSQQLQSDIDGAVHSIPIAGITPPVDPAQYATKEYVDQQDSTLAGEVSALEAKVDDLSTGKYYGYFAQEEDLPEADVDGFAYVGEGPTYTIYNLRGGVWTSSDITVNQSPIGNGKDINQDEDGKLQFANRTYNAQQPDGMGYKILRKDATFASQVTDTNTIYEIRYAFDLEGASVTIPSGCVLKFVGGVLSNGTLVGNGTIIGAKEEVIFSSGVSISGTWLIPNVHAVWFGDITSSNRINQLFKLCNNSIHNNVFIPDSGSDYIVTISNDVVHDDAIVIQDMTGIDIFFDGTIKLSNNNVPDYDIIRIYGCKDISIKGCGVIQGDRAGHDYTSHSGDSYATHEWGRGIHVMKSQNVFVEGISVRETTGDGFNCHFGFSAFNDDVEYTSNLSFRNINSYGCRRNGFVIGSANNILIDNYKCEFTTMAGSAANTDPVVGIDIEPDPNNNEVARDIVLSNIYVKGAKRCIDIIGINSETHDISISNLYCQDTTDALIYFYYCDSVSVKNVYSKASERCQYLLYGAFSSNIHVENVVADHQFLIIFNITDGVWNLSNINLKSATNSGTLFSSNISGDHEVFLDGARGVFGRVFTAAASGYVPGKFVFRGCNLSSGATPEILNGAGVTLINTTITGLYGDIQLNGATIINSMVKFNATSKKVDVTGAVFANFNQFVADSVTYPSTQIAGVPTKGTMYVDQGALKWSDGSAWVAIGS